jgi:hypothetical protein
VVGGESLGVALEVEELLGDEQQLVGDLGAELLERRDDAAERVCPIRSRRCRRRSTLSVVSARIASRTSGRRICATRSGRGRPASFL